MKDNADERDLVDLEQAAVLVAELLEANATASAAQARAAAIAARLARSGVVEQLEGLMLEQVLVLESRLCQSDARLLITAGEVLADMPVLAGLVGAGKVSWSVVRQVVWRVRALGRLKRDAVDQRLAASVAEHGDIQRFDPDQLVDAVERAVTDLRSAAQAERAERRTRRDNFVAVQRDFDGGIKGHFRFDPVAGAIVLNALDDAAEHISRANADDVADAPSSADEPGHPDAGGHPDVGRGRQLGRALERIAHAWLGGGRGGTARPALVVHVPLGEVSVNGAGQVELNVRGALLPTITAATLEQLATDATLRTVLFDGARPLAAAAKRNAARPPADVRLAVAARDRGDRFPGSSDPLAWCDLHHLHERVRGGDHDVDNLAYLSRRNHVLSHRYGWTASLDPATGALTIRRRGKAYTSLPPGTALARAPDRPLDRRPPGTAARARAGPAPPTARVGPPAPGHRAEEPPTPGDAGPNPHLPF